MVQEQSDWKRVRWFRVGGLLQGLRICAGREQDGLLLFQRCGSVPAVHAWLLDTHFLPSPFAVLPASTTPTRTPLVTYGDVGNVAALPAARGGSAWFGFLWTPHLDPSFASTAVLPDCSLLLVFAHGLPYVFGIINLSVPALTVPVVVWASDGRVAPHLRISTLYMFSADIRALWAVLPSSRALLRLRAAAPATPLLRGSFCCRACHPCGVRTL